MTLLPNVFFSTLKSSPPIQEMKTCELLRQINMPIPISLTYIKHINIFAYGICVSICVGMNIPTLGVPFFLHVLFRFFCRPAII